MAAPRFRIELRRVLGYSEDPEARVAALEPYAHQLLDGGVDGELLLVEQATGEVVARRAVWVPGSRPPVDESELWWGSRENAGLPAEPGVKANRPGQPGH